MRSSAWCVDTLFEGAWKRRKKRWDARRGDGSKEEEIGTSVRGTSDEELDQKGNEGGKRMRGVALENLRCGENAQVCASWYCSER